MNNTRCVISILWEDSIFPSLLLRKANILLTNTWIVIRECRRNAVIVALSYCLISMLRPGHASWLKWLFSHWLWSRRNLKGRRSKDYLEEAQGRRVTWDPLLNIGSENSISFVAYKNHNLNQWWLIDNGNRVKKYEWYLNQYINLFI